jgi:hypothetical protein
MSPENLEDIYDGEHYAASHLLRELFTISFSMNTDGAPPFDSTSKTLWPVYLVINELPPNIRFAVQSVFNTQI